MQQIAEQADLDQALHRSSVAHAYEQRVNHQHRPRGKTQICASVSAECLRKTVAPNPAIVSEILHDLFPSDADSELLPTEVCSAHDLKLFLEQDLATVVDSLDTDDPYAATNAAAATAAAAATDTTQLLPPPPSPPPPPLQQTSSVDQLPTTNVADLKSTAAKLQSCRDSDTGEWLTTTSRHDSWKSWRAKQPERSLELPELSAASERKSARLVAKAQLENRKSKISQGCCEPKSGTARESATDDLSDEEHVEQDEHYSSESSDSSGCDDKPLSPVREPRLVQLVPAPN
eukprot:COSAG01_NODE_19090_length_1031_cov_2.312232_1_plen_288_part_10